MGLGKFFKRVSPKIGNSLKSNPKLLAAGVGTGAVLLAPEATGSLLGGVGSKFGSVFGTVAGSVTDGIFGEGMMTYIFIFIIIIGCAYAYNTFIKPSSGTSSTPSPQYEQPQYNNQQYEQPQYNNQQYGQPQYY